MSSALLKYLKGSLLTVLLFLAVHHSSYGFAQDVFDAHLNARVIPNGFGISTASDPVFIDGVKNTGLKIVRTDFIWQDVEPVKGKYNFSKYDRFVETAIKAGMTPLFILDYNNTRYTPSGGKIQGIRDEETRQGFVRFAYAAAERYKQHSVIWEIWNEPNHSVFWNPAPNAIEYMQLAKAVVPAIRTANPNAVILAPATSEIPYSFLEACFKEGLLNMVDGLSIHPYERRIPEKVVERYDQLRSLMARYDGQIPIVSSEWGYSDAWPYIKGQVQQAQFLERMFLVNIWQGIPISIYYSWRDSGNDHRFGLVTSENVEKPAFQGAKRLTNALSGYRFVSRINSMPSDYIMIFENGSDKRLAAWAIEAPHEIVIPEFNCKVMLTQTPLYLTSQCQAINP